jgi:hypothetical protein
VVDADVAISWILLSDVDWCWIADDQDRERKLM